MNPALRPIRIIIYLTTLFYAFINAGLAPEEAFVSNIGEPGILSTFVVATTVGIVQTVFAIVGMIIDVSPLRHKSSSWMKYALLGLTLTYMYELAIIVIYDGSPFRWVPFLVYTVICAVLFLAEE